MNLKRRRVVIGLGLAGLVLLPGILWCLRAPESDGPTYEGKTLKQWLEHQKPTMSGPVELTSQAEAAVRALGSRAIPTLLAWLSQYDSSFHRNAKIWLEWRFGLPLHVQLNQEKRFRAVYGFRALGAAGRPAWPAIVQILLHSPDDWQRGDAISALTEADGEAMKLIVAGLKDTDKEIRLRAIHAIACLRIEPDALCYPALEQALNDSDIWVRGSAGNAIALLDDQLKALATGVNNPKSSWRPACARLIGGYGTRARLYLHELEIAAESEDPELRAAALEAIGRVRGEASNSEETAQEGRAR